MKKLLLAFIITLCISSLCQNYLYAEMRSSVSSYGITWTFDAQYECGQFVAGDWWVVGPVTITSVSPTPTAGRNGSMLNPVGAPQGYDDRSQTYNASLSVAFPVTLNGINSLVSTISETGPTDCVTTAGNAGWTARNGRCDNRPHTRTMAVLTIVNTPIPSGTFRPSYIGSSYKDFINVSSIDYNVLPRLPQVASIPNTSELGILLDRPWLDHFNGWTTQLNYAFDNGPGYGTSMADDIIKVGASIMLDIPEQEYLTRLMIQRGIDIYQGILNGAYWPADGGHASGRKLPVLLAGKLLNHQGMLDIGINYLPDSRTFGEDCQTYYDSQGFPRWGIRHCQDPNNPGFNDETNNYRFCCTSKIYVGEALIAMMLGLRNEWNHEAFFDYTDRWINEGGSYGSSFVQELWGIYRNNLPQEIPHSGGVPDNTPPSAPTALAASGVTGNSLTLNWNASTDNISVTAYDIYKDGTLGTTIAGITTSVLIEGLTCNTSYTFKVLARDPSGNVSDFSNIINVSTTGDCNTNVALNKSVSVMSEDLPDNPGSNLVNGNTADDSRWSASGFPQSATIDLGSDHDLSSIELYTYQSRAYQYTVEGMPEGGSYSTIVDRSSNTSSTQPITDNVTTVARYVRITVTGASGYAGTWISLNELEIIGEPLVGTVPVTGVTLSASSLNLEVDQSSDLTETVMPANATNKNVTWSSNNTAVAIVDANGLVTAISAGNATITVTTIDGGYTANCAVTVTASGGGTLTNVALNKPVTVDSEYNTTYVAENAVDGDNSTTTGRWLSANSAYPHWIEIDLQGTYSVEKANFWTGYNGYNNAIADYQIQYWTGSAWANAVNTTGNSAAVVTHTFTTVTTTKVRLYATDGATDNILRLYEIEVWGAISTIPVTGVTLSASSLNLDSGQTSDLDETVSPVDATDKSVTWSSNNTSVATVDVNGLVTAVSAGSAIITVTTNDGGFTDNCNVTVTSAQPVTLNPITDSYVRGLSFANSNFGTDNIFYVKYHSYAEYDRQGYLKFDLSGISEPVSSAMLRLYVRSSDGSSTHTVKLVNDDSWTETGITYNNKPAAGSAINTFNVSSAGNYVEVDITSAVNAETGGILSLQITSNNDRYIGYDSREGANKPELHITFGGQSNAPITYNTVNPKAMLNVYPNPASNGYVNIDLLGYDTKADVTLKIMDVTGRVVYAKNFNASDNIQISPNIKSGLYIINITNENLSLDSKLLVK